MEDPVDDLFDMDDENDPQPMKEAKKEDEVYKDEHFSDLDDDFFGDDNADDAQKDTADHEKIQQAVSEILKNSNINELSIKDIKEQLSLKYEIDIKKNKQFIRETIEKQLADSEVPVEADGDDGELDAATGKRNTTAVTAKKRQSVFSKPALLSPALAEFMGQQLAPRQEVVKFLWKYIKEHELQNPKDKRIVLFDEKLQKIFKKKSSHFMKLTKLLFKELKTVDQVAPSSLEEEDEDDEEEEEEDAEESDDEKDNKKKNAKKRGSSVVYRKGKPVNDKKRQKTEETSSRRRSKARQDDEEDQDDDEEEEEEEEEVKPKKKKASSSRKASVKLVVPEFAELLKVETTAPRKNVVKELHNYIKEHNLQNPKDKREILLDETLQSFFKVKKCTFFSINKYLNKVFYEE